MAEVVVAAEVAVAALMAVVMKVAVDKVVGPAVDPTGWLADAWVAARRVEMEAMTEVTTATVVPMGV